MGFFCEDFCHERIDIIIFRRFLTSFEMTAPSYDTGFFGAAAKPPRQNPLSSTHFLRSFRIVEDNEKSLELEPFEQISILSRKLLQNIKSRNEKQSPCFWKTKIKQSVVISFRFAHKHPRQHFFHR